MTNLMHEPALISLPEQLHDKLGGTKSRLYVAARNYVFKASMSTIEPQGYTFRYITGIPVLLYTFSPLVKTRVLGHRPKI